MGKAPLLQQLYRQHLARFGSHSALENIASAYLDESTFSEIMLKEACSEICQQTAQGSPLTALEPWRELVSLLLMLHESPFLDSVKNELKAHAQQLCQTIAWPTFQLASIYHALVEFLLEEKQQVQKNDRTARCIQMPSGAAPLEQDGHWPWAQIPHPRFHAELGTLWAVYALVTDSGDHKKTAEKLAEWQRHTLDHQFSPFIGLFSREEDVTESSLLIYNSLLFTAASTVKKNSTMAALADKQLEFLQKLPLGTVGDISVHAAVLEKWLTKGRDTVTFSSVEKITVPSTVPSIEDKSLALVGCRLENSSAVSTLYGGGTGMGCFHAGAVQIVNYGPQLAHILGDCRGFGILGNHKRLRDYPHKAEQSANGYRLEGLSCVVPRPHEQDPQALFRIGKHSGFWVDSKQIFEDGKLSIEAQFYGVHDVNELAFAFFVKAKNCTVGAGRIVQPRSFDRYRGNVCPVVMQSAESVVSIIPENCSGEMQVIPLGGERAFWGADFLVAYLLDNKLCRYKWSLS